MPPSSKGICPCPAKGHALVQQRDMTPPAKRHAQKHLLSSQVYELCSTTKASPFLCTATEQLSSDPGTVMQHVTTAALQWRRLLLLLQPVLFWDWEYCSTPSPALNCRFSIIIFYMCIFTIIRSVFL